MSETTAAGSGGSPAPGWYADPSDPALLRWWSGDAWTEHVSAAPDATPVAPAAPTAPEYPAAEQPLAPEPVAAVAVAAEPVFAEPVAPMPVSPAPVIAETAPAPSAFAPPDYAPPVPEQPVAPPPPVQQFATAEPVAPTFTPVATEPVAPAAAAFPVASQQPTSVVQPGDPLPSRRALREPHVETNDAVRPAESFAPSVPAAAEQSAPPALAQPSAPVPTLPVQPTTFLEQAGYAPLDGAPVPSAAVAPQAAAPEPAPPAAPVPPQAFTPPAPQAFQPPVQHQVQPLQADAWDQAAQDAGSFAGIAPVPGQWSQPAAPAQTELPAVPAPAVSSAALPPVAVPEAVPGSIESLLGTAPAAPVVPGALPPVGDAPAAGWGTAPAPAEVEPGVRRRSDDAAVSNAGGSSTVWSWLIALSPIIAAGAIGYVIASTGYVTTGWPLEAAVAAPYLLVALFALADRAALVTLGHSQPRSPAWALLTAPVYLIIRASETRREDGTGTGLTLVWFVSFLVGLGGFVGYGLLTHHALIASLPT